MNNHTQNPANSGQPQESPILYFTAIYRGDYQRIAAYSAESARKQAIGLLGGIGDFYQTFPIDADYSDFPDIQAQKLAALGGEL